MFNTNIAWLLNCSLIIPTIFFHAELIFNRVAYTLDPVWKDTFIFETSKLIELYPKAKTVIIRDLRTVCVSGALRNPRRVFVDVI